MRQRNNAFKEVRYKVAQKALAGIKVGVLGRKYDMSPKIIHNWVKEYREILAKKKVELVLSLKRSMVSISCLQDLTYDIMAIDSPSENILLNITEQYSDINTLKQNYSKHLKVIGEVLRYE